MSRILDVSGKLGEYMLKGWVLTDKICPTPGCNVPLLRTPAARSETKHYCANCEIDPDVPAIVPETTTATSLSNSSTHHSNSSTHPTEISSGLSSPTSAPPVETAESLRRRQQSDYASAEIGKRLLQGYAMLADECPREACHGVPLVRPPRPGGGKDPRKQCVVCETDYISQRDANGIERLTQRASQQSPKASTASANLPGVHFASTNDRAQDFDKPLFNSSVPANQLGYSGTTTVLHTQSATIRANDHHQDNNSFKSQTHSGVIRNVNSLDVSAISLEKALSVLSETMDKLTSSANIPDTTSIGATADAMGKVVQALSQIRQISRS